MLSSKVSGAIGSFWACAHEARFPVCKWITSSVRDDEPTLNVRSRHFPPPLLSVSCCHTDHSRWKINKIKLNCLCFSTPARLRHRGSYASCSRHSSDRLYYYYQWFLAPLNYGTTPHPWGLLATVGVGWVRSEVRKRTRGFGNVSVVASAPSHVTFDILLAHTLISL